MKNVQEIRKHLGRHKIEEIIIFQKVTFLTTDFIKDLCPIFERYSKITEVIYDSLRFYKIQRNCQINKTWKDFTKDGQNSVDSVQTSKI